MAKPTIMLLTSALLGVFASSAHAREVTLMSGDVTSALDIEQAIRTATQNDTEPGVVTLDGQDGEFIYDVDGDRSINLTSSNITLRGIHNAVISNCDDGVFFEGTDFDHVAVLNISFMCTTGVGIRGGSVPSIKKHIHIAGNHIEAPDTGIVLSGLRKSLIRANTVVAGQRAIVITTDGKSSAVTFNEVQATIGIDVAQSCTILIALNFIDADRTGVRLRGESSRNSVIANRIDVGEFIGVNLDESTSENRVLANRSPDGEAVRVVDLGTDNKVD